MILDTTAVIDLLRGKTSEPLKETQTYEAMTTSITVFEVNQGLKQKDRQKVQEFFQNITVLDFDAKSAEKSGEIQAKLRAEGQIIDLEDCMIAGIAVQNEKQVLTANKKHFRRIKELDARFY